MKFSIQQSKDDLCLESLKKMTLNNFLAIRSHSWYINWESLTLNGGQTLVPTQKSKNRSQRIKQQTSWINIKEKKKNYNGHLDNGRKVLVKLPEGKK